MPEINLHDLFEKDTGLRLNTRCEICNFTAYTDCVPEEGSCKIDYKYKEWLEEKLKLFLNGVDKKSFTEGKWKGGGIKEHNSEPKPNIIPPPQPRR